MLRKLLHKVPGFAHLRSINRASVSVPSQLRHQLGIAAEQLRISILAQAPYQDPRHLARYEGQVFSQTGADGIIAEIFRRIGAESKLFVEIGTEDGMETNTTFLLWQGWSGWWIEGEEKHIRSINTTFEKPIAEKRLTVSRQFVTAENINQLLESARIPPSPDLLSLDIDRNTYWVLKALTCRPRVIVVEYNASIPPSVAWAVEYHPEKTWSGTDYFGASLKMYEQWGHDAGYQLVGCDLAGFNAFFVRTDLAKDLFPSPATAEHLHEPRRGCFGTRMNGFLPAVMD